MDRDTSFQDRLKRLWVQYERTHGAKLSQEKLGRMIGVSQTMLSALRNEEGRLPNSPNLKALADFFGVDQDWLMTGKGEPNPVTSLSGEESELLLLFRAVSPAARTYISSRLQDMYRDEFGKGVKPNPSPTSPNSDDPVKPPKYQ
jgi:transcriptional regulator with XRE-family HTH domain